MTAARIELYSFGYFEGPFLAKLAEAVGQEFALPVSVQEGHLDFSEFYEPARRQYDANMLLKAVDQAYGSPEAKTFGLFYVDLFIPILTYLFGQAYLGGRTGVASIYRLSNERYGLREPGNTLFERLNKTVIHELGHTFGMVHCHVPGCVMVSATYVEELDLKERHFCAACRGVLSGLQ